jgi:hypothetical protein
VRDMAIEDIESELPIRYNEIKKFYKDISCVGSNEWTGRFILIDENTIEPIAIPKSIKSDELKVKMDIYNSMMMAKLAAEEKKIDPIVNAIFTVKPVECKDGKPTVIMN